MDRHLSTPCLRCSPSFTKITPGNLMMRSTTAAALVVFGLLLPAAASAETDISADGYCAVNTTHSAELECLTIAGNYTSDLYYNEICSRTLTLTNTCEVPISIVELDCENEACISETLEPGDELAVDLALSEPYAYGDESSLSRHFEVSTDTTDIGIEITIRNFYEEPEHPYEPPIDEGDTGEEPGGADTGDESDTGEELSGADTGDENDAGSGNEQTDPGEGSAGGCSTSGNTPGSALLTMAGALGLVILRRRP
ncbi:hypothetical protein EA187_08615 [Lujinxingia sediminis]|uniref:PGF-CTERM sorting domain-containing protein n=2 Tax=Lujinxingia sediminis TaxID=2480984 RepID=A0ABY0CUT9_9DELT|nr:hypothetical protein EA187_08615 [Lujinxingia sediminis]